MLFDSLIFFLNKRHFCWSKHIFQILNNTDELSYNYFVKCSLILETLDLFSHFIWYKTFWIALFIESTLRKSQFWYDQILCWILWLLLCSGFVQISRIDNVRAMLFINVTSPPNHIRSYIECFIIHIILYLPFFKIYFKAGSTIDICI